MKNAVPISVHTLKDTWYLGRQMSHLSVQTILTVSSNLPYYVKKTSSTSETSIDE
jgi:hypothetical protein